MKRKIFFISLLCLLVFFEISNAENIVFPNFSSQVSHLELDLRLFDFAVNHLNIISSGPLTYINSISSRAFTNKRIECWVSVSPLIMKGTLPERKKRINDFCDHLFLEYQKRFMLMDLDYQKKAGEVGQQALPMKPCHLKIYIHTSEMPSKFLAEWECGSLSYKDDFISN
jgi:hypothetical protein